MSCPSCGEPRTGTFCTNCGTGPFSTAEQVVGGSLVSSLTPVVDRLRDLKTRLGARQYEVRLVWTRWTGGRRGSGDEYIFREEQLLPTPRVADLTSVNKELTEVGLAEAGSLRVDEISPRYSERRLLGFTGEEKLPDDVSFYWEVRTVHRPDGDVRRRFFPMAAPSYSPTRFQWTVSLIRAHADRAPAGLPRRLDN